MSGRYRPEKGGGTRALSPTHILEDIGLLSTIDEGMSSYQINWLDPYQLFGCYSIRKQKDFTLNVHFTVASRCSCCLQTISAPL